MSATPTSDSLIDHSDALVFVFDEGLDGGSVVLGGSMAAYAADAVLSTTTVENDTLTVSPTSSWKGGFGHSLNVTVADTAGNATSALPIGYDLRLLFNNFQPASVVLGQTSFTSDENDPVSSTTVTEIYGIAVVDGRLYVGGDGFDRVLIFNSIPTVNNTPADSVLGKTDLSDDTNVSPPTASSLENPFDIDANETHLAIADYADHRVLLYSPIPASGPTDASLVLGQAAFDTQASSCSASGLKNPQGVAITANKVIVADQSNHRVLIWNSTPTTNGQAADIVLGQANMDTCDAPAGPTASSLSAPMSVWTDGTRLLVADSGNHKRILVWNSFPTSNNQAADVVIGRPDFTTNGANTPQTGLRMNEPDMHSNGTQLCIDDADNNRVLIWNDIPTTNGFAPDIVLGQSDLTHVTANDDDQNDADDGSPTARTMNQAYGCHFHQDRLIVTEYAGNRIKIYESN